MAIDDGTTRKLSVLSGESDCDETSRTFMLCDEGHTLGNALRYMIMKNPHVAFCGYSIPHPSENKIHMRIQTRLPLTAKEALRKGLEDLEQVTDHILSTFQQEVESFKQQTVQ